MELSKRTYLDVEIARLTELMATDTHLHERMCRYVLSTVHGKDLEHLVSLCTAGHIAIRYAKQLLRLVPDAGVIAANLFPERVCTYIHTRALQTIEIRIARDTLKLYRDMVLPMIIRHTDRIGDERWSTGHRVTRATKNGCTILCVDNQLLSFKQQGTSTYIHDSMRALPRLTRHTFTETLDIARHHIPIKGVVMLVLQYCS
jgi:hypothetical protein